jgi:hypothetical protein
MNIHSSLAALGFVAIAACSSGNSSSSSTPPPTGTVGTSCTAASQCYAALDGATLRGEATCLTQLTNGYCTHTCQSDADCCTVPGECPSGFAEICAPFESTSKSYCFLSCDSSTLAAEVDAGTDPTTFCEAANPTFTCRSTGGGAANKKFCGP